MPTLSHQSTILQVFLGVVTGAFFILPVIELAGCGGTKSPTKSASNQPQVPENTCGRIVSGSIESSTAPREELGIHKYEYRLDFPAKRVSFVAKKADGTKRGTLEIDATEARSGSNSHRIEIRYTNAEGETLQSGVTVARIPRPRISKSERTRLAVSAELTANDQTFGLMTLGSIEEGDSEPISPQNPLLDTNYAALTFEGESESKLVLVEDGDPKADKQTIIDWQNANELSEFISIPVIQETEAILQDKAIYETMRGVVLDCMQSFRNGSASPYGTKQSPLCSRELGEFLKGFGGGLFVGSLGAFFLAEAGVFAGFGQIGGGGASLATGGTAVALGFGPKEAGMLSGLVVGVGLAACVATGACIVGTLGVIIGGAVVGAGLIVAGHVIVENSGVSCGNPLLISGDGVSYPFRGVGEFIWVRRSDRKPIEVQIRQLTNPESSCAGAVRIGAAAIRVEGHRLGFYPGRERVLWVDDEPVESSRGFLPVTNRVHVERRIRSAVGEATYFVEWRSGEQLRVDVFEDRLDLEFDAPEERRASLEGLLGNFNGNPSDELTLRSGEHLEEPVDWNDLYGKFAESWRVRPEESLFNYRDGRGPEDYHRRDLPREPRTLDELTDEQRDYGRRICRQNGGITDPTLLKECIKDVGCTRDAEYMRTFARISPPKRELEIVYPDGDKSTSLTPTGTVSTGGKNASFPRKFSKPGSTNVRTNRQAACNTDDNKSSTTGDPHLTTVDGLSYSLQSVGEFVLLESLAHDSFEIQVRQGPIRSNNCPNVTYNKAIAAQVGEHRVTVNADRDPALRIDGEATKLEEIYRPLGDGHGVMKVDEDTYALSWPEGEYLRVENRGSNVDLRLYLPDSRRGQLRGLFGQFNEEPDDDIVLRNGTVLEPPVSWNALHGRFADSWRITDEESLFDYESGKSTKDHTDKTAPGAPTRLADVPDSEQKSARKTCKEAGVKNTSVLKDCIIDVYCTGDSSYADDHAEREAPEKRLDVRDPVVLNGWTHEGATSSGNWEVSKDGQSVTQTYNDGSQSNPSMFVSPTDYFDTTIRGTIETTDSDDDYMGIVFGYEKPLSANGDDPSTFDLYAFVWKQAAQSKAPEGMSLIRATSSAMSYNWWSIESAPGFEVLDTNYGQSTGWNRGTQHEFALSYTKDSIEIAVDGEAVLSASSSQVGHDFQPGRFGFYNFSQAGTTYGNLTVGGKANTQLVDAPSSLEKDAFESSSTIFVAREGEAVSIDQKTTVDYVLDGSYGSMGDDYASNCSVPSSNTAINSYLVHYDPASSGPSVVTGEYTFAGDVIGVINDGDELIGTDEFLGAAGTTYPQDSSRAAQGDSGVTVRENRQTLSFELDASDGLAQMRVLTWPQTPQSSFTKGEHPRSCQAVMNGGKTQSGTYTIDPDGKGGVPPQTVFCDMQTDGGGWTMVSKISADVGGTGECVWAMGGLNGDQTTLDGTTADGDYSSRLVQQLWNRGPSSISEVRVDVIDSGKVAKTLQFDGKDTDWTSWFGPDNYISSSWTDIGSEQQNYFALEGPEIGGRRDFYINRNWGGCSSDNGWLMMTNPGDTCASSWGVQQDPAIMYANPKTYGNWTSGEFSFADALVVYVR